MVKEDKTTWKANYFTKLIVSESYIFPWIISVAEIQNCSNSSALAMELPKSCAKPLIENDTPWY